MLNVPAATGLASAVVNAGHEINTVPDAALPSARYIVSLTVVLTGCCAEQDAANRTQAIPMQTSEPPGFPMSPPDITERHFTKLPLPARVAHANGFIASPCPAFACYLPRITPAVAK